jgi:hypothetical protein
MLLHEQLPLAQHILPTLVILESLDDASSLLLSPSLVQLESREGLILGVEQVDAPIARMGIHKGDPVLELVGGEGKRSMEVRMNEFQWFGEGGSGRGEWIACHLAI